MFLIWLLVACCTKSRKPARSKRFVEQRAQFVRSIASFSDRGAVLAALHVPGAHEGFLVKLAGSLVHKPLDVFDHPVEGERLVGADVLLHPLVDAHVAPAELYGIGPIFAAIRSSAFATLVGAMPLQFASATGV